MKEKYKKIRVASILGILGNLFLAIIKGIVGILTTSQAMTADAFNSLSDIISSVMTFIGNHIASKPSDNDHQLGHGKAEYIYSMLISIIMFLLAISAFKDSVLSFFNPGKYTFSIWLIIVCIITIVVKFLLYLYTNKLSKKYQNLLIKANSKDHRNDCFLTLFTLLASIFSLFDLSIVDSIVGVGISIWILITAFEIFKESYDVLMDKSINPKAMERVFEIIEDYPEVKKVSHFCSTPVGYLYQISFTIYVDGELKTKESHDIAEMLEVKIKEEISEVYLVVIHVNPV